MDVSLVTAFAVLEVLLVAAVYAVFLHYRARRSGDETSPDLDKPAETDQFAAMLQARILETETRLAGLDVDDSATGDEKRLLEFRQALLTAECKAAENAGSDEERHWSLLAERLTPLLPVRSSEDDVDSKLVESLRLQISAYETQLSSLEKFRDLFFELKGKLADSNARGDQLQIEVCRAVPEEDQSPELKKLLKELESENQQLNEQLEHVENAFTAILKKAEQPAEAGGEGIAGAMSGIDRDVNRIRNIISDQEKRISELSLLIEEKEMALADKEEVEKALAELRETGEEMESVIVVMEEENQFLQQQISMLLKQELDSGNKIKEEAGSLAKQLEDLQAEHARLADKFAAMEKEYLIMYEENQSLKGEGS